MLLPAASPCARPSAGLWKSSTGSQKSPRPPKDPDTAAVLEAIRSEFPSVTDFERDFPSLCFALATGVGKTRLMGAFISYLYLEHGIGNFFVLAPNLTIYNKLIADFTPNTQKYVFKGIAEFASNAPTVITGDTYESGIGVRESLQGQLRLPWIIRSEGVHVNIFNISKINSEVRGESLPELNDSLNTSGRAISTILRGCRIWCCLWMNPTGTAPAQGYGQSMS